MSKELSPQQAIDKIRPRDTVCTTGFVGTGTPEELIRALERRFLKTGAPFDLSLVFAAAPGDGVDQGVNRLAHPGLLKRIVGGHWALVPKLGELAVNNKVEAYNLPLGVMSELFREIAGQRCGVLTKIGLGTFVDPRQQGGKLNRSTWEDLVEVVEVHGEEWLLYKTFPIDVAFIRGTTADANGNISMENEALTLDNLAIATAARNSGGIVIAQVEQTVNTPLSPRDVEVPGILVDHVVVAQADNHRQTWATDFNPAFAGQSRVAVESAKPMELDERKVIARRAAMELVETGGVVNLGIGMPEGVSKVAAEEGFIDEVNLTAEPGVIGGMPQGGLDFGAAINHHALLNQNQQFDFYDGGGLDLAILGMAQVDQHGHVNVSKFGKRLAGAGGFINISQTAKRLVFVGTFTAGGLKTDISDGKVNILKEGAVAKFIQDVEQITFNARVAAGNSQPVLYITERCVFELTASGIRLKEVAPGIDITTQILDLLPFSVIVDDVAVMDERIFADAPMGLREKDEFTSHLETVLSDRLVA
ncbi:MAG TPA: acyl CoA:acetate/3-ketoacid CoA transferase [Gammaproteobacteria bacterium]|nr:acyl CoA:acetate/3-ketoacid CoA transferase [Gammaproteobacteria bacterium]|tara:strand:- start:313 stop:1911 length:1599 start_codon:yes stop_codon:yes gene_type:complete